MYVQSATTREQTHRGYYNTKSIRRNVPTIGEWAKFAHDDCLSVSSKSNEAG